MSRGSVNGNSHGDDTSTKIFGYSSIFFFFFFCGEGVRQIKKKKSVIFSAVTVTTAGWVLLVPDPKPFTKQMLDR